MRARLPRLVPLALFGAALFGASRAPAQAPAVADPSCAYLVDGEVRLANGHPAASVVVERTTDARGRHPRGGGDDRHTTDARGHFEFRFDGLGVQEVGPWTLAVRRPGCSGAVKTVALHEGVVPPRGSPGYVARGVVIRLPACAADR